MEHSINVFERAWGRRVGNALMRELFVRAERSRIHIMIGGIDGTNSRSLDFHARFGSLVVASLPEAGWKHGCWCDLVLVQRFIDGRGPPR